MAMRRLVSVVDDDESVRESLPDLLRSFGLETQPFASAEAFLASECLHRTGCLVLDVAMQGMSGPELQRELAQRAHDIPIVFITAHSVERVRPQVLKRGAVACLFKPFSEAAILDAVNTALGRGEHLVMQSLAPGCTLAFGSAAEVSTMSDARPTVFVVDDDVSVRESLEALIEVAGWRARAFDSAQGFLDCPPAFGPNCLVLDVSLPDLSGLDVQSRIASERAETPIIFITGYGDVPMTVRAMKAGAVEFLIKPFDDDVLLDAIAAALDRSRAVVGEQAALQALRHRHATLSRREREVMALVVSGLLNKQVGGELGISEITVKAHRGRVMKKMRARSLAELVKISERLGAATPTIGR